MLPHPVKPTEELELQFWVWQASRPEHSRSPSGRRGSHQLGRLAPRRAERKLSSFFREVRAPAPPFLSGRVHGFPFWTTRRGSLFSFSLPEAVGLKVTWLLALVALGQGHTGCPNDCVEPGSGAEVSCAGSPNRE